MLNSRVVGVVVTTIYWCISCVPSPCDNFFSDDYLILAMAPKASQTSANSRCFFIHIHNSCCLQCASNLQTQFCCLSWMLLAILPRLWALILILQAPEHAMMFTFILRTHSLSQSLAFYLSLSLHGIVASFRPNKKAWTRIATTAYALRINTILQEFLFHTRVCHDSPSP